MASNINAELMLEIKGFLEGIKNSQNAANKFAKNGKNGASGWQAGLKNVGGAIVAVGAAALKAAAAVAAVGAAVTTALAAGIKNAFDMGGKFSDLAAQMGTTAGKARLLAAAFENNGMQADETAKTVNKMQKSLNDAGNGLAAAKRAFGELGLDPEALMTGDPVDAFHTIVDALGGIQGESKRTAVAMDIFGRSGGKLNVLLKDKDALKNAANLIGRQAALLDEHANQFDRASDVLNQVKTKVQGFFVGVGAKIIEQIMPAIEALNSLDLTGIGERFGAALSTALDYAVAIFKTFHSLGLEEIGKLFGVALRLGVSKAVNVLFAGGSAVMSAIIAYLIEGVKNSVALLGILATKGFWAGMLNALLGIAKVFAGFMLKRISQVITAIKEATGKVGKKIFGDSDEKLAEAGQALQDGSKDDFKKAGNDLAPAFGVVTDRMKKTGAAVAGAFSRTFANAADIIDTEGDEARLGAVGDKIRTLADELKKTRESKKVEGPDEGGTESANAGGGLPAINSRLSGAINTIAGRSANAVIASEAAKTSQNTERTAKAAEQIAANTAGDNNNGKPKPKPVATGSGKFS